MRVIINGIGGKVGRILYNTLSASKNAMAVAGVDKYADATEFAIPIFNDINKCDVQADVIIDFSRPDAIDSILGYAIEKRINVVLATTGYTSRQQHFIDEASKIIAIFQTSNMSLGVTLLSDICRQAAKFLGSSFDIEIIEQHHNLKIDSPSGTALYLANEINKVFDNEKEYIYGRHSNQDKRESAHIGIHAIRGGTIVGKHDVMFIGTDEVVTLSHEAQSRKVFALGSIRAAEYIIDKTYGKFSMDNIIGKDYAVTTVSGTDDTTLINIQAITSEQFSQMLKSLGDNCINLDMISRVRNDKNSNTVSFTLPSLLNTLCYQILKELDIDYTSRENAAKLLIAGAGMAHECGVAEEVFTLLNEIGTEVYAVTTSETEISCCIDAENRVSSERMLRKHYRISI